MLDHGGYRELSLLLTSSENHSSQTMALDSFCLLVSALPHFTNHTPPPMPAPPTQYCRYVDSDLCPFDLTLVVLTNRIPVHRHVMIGASNVFRVMLEGPYKEGRVNEVTLNTHPTAFTALVHHLYGCTWKCPRVDHTLVTSTDRPHPLTTPTDCTQQLISSIAYDTHSPLDTAHCLRVMVIAGQYLLDELSTLCQHAAVQYVLPSNVVEMFYLSRMHQCHCLSESCLRVVMAMGEARRDVLRDLLTSYVSNDVLNMFKMFITIS